MPDLLLLLFLTACAGPEKAGDTAPITEDSPSETGETASTSEVDADGDGYPVQSDCDDSDAAVSPSAPEVCNGADDDCDLLVDDADPDVVGRPVWYPDVDADGFGDENSAFESCAAQVGAVGQGGDCDDSAATVHPGATETCDGADEDCDGLADEACHTALAGTLSDEEADSRLLSPCGESYAGRQIWLADVDGDGLDDALTWSRYCTAPDLHVALGPLWPVEDLAASDSLWTAGVVEDDPVVDFAGGVDVTGDGLPDWAVVEGDLVSGPVTLRMFDEPMTGSETVDDTRITILESPPDDQAFLRGLRVTLLPGMPGTILATGWFASGTDADDFSITTALAGDAVGNYDSNALVTFEGTVAGRHSTEDATWHAVGDVDGDGYADMLRVDYGDLIRDEDQVDLFLGPVVSPSPDVTPDLALGSDRVNRYEGVSKADLDADGLSDILIGAPGYVYRTTVTSGRIEIDHETPILVGGSAEDLPGVAVTTLDADGDDITDIGVSSEYGYELGIAIGGVYLVYGPFVGVRELGTDGATILGSTGMENLGFTLDSGDSNGDGFDDLLVGSGNGLRGGDATPVAWLFLGGPEDPVE